jgi:hypothetical protein
MGTTPNYAIPYPEITDFVADGAVAMENIAEKVDLVLASATNGRNRLINGDFRVAQRGTSFVAGANNDDTYNLDRWYVLSEVNDTVDITQSSVAPTGGLFSIGLDVETINNKFGIAQIIETRNLVGCVGSQCTLSFKFRTSGSSIGNVKAAIIAWTGTSDTVTSDFVSTWNADGVNPTLIANAVYENTPINLNPTNSWQTASITALIDAAGTNNIAVFIWCDDKTTTLADFLYVTDVQFEVGSVATAFERKTFSDVLSECRRYYFRATANSTNLFSWFAFGMAGNSTTAAEFWFSLPMQLRTTPSSIDVANLRMTDLTGAYTVFTLTLSTVRTSTDFISLGATSTGLTPYRTLTLESNNTSAGYVGVSAEL